MINAGFLRKPRARRLALLLALAGTLVVLGLRGAAVYAGEFPPIGGNDFIEYWSAARLLRDGGNPYDPVALLAVQREAGWPGPEPILMWNPPWTLALVLPLSFLGFGPATLVWLLLQTGLILSCGLLLWRYFAPGDSRHWIGLALAAGFVPGLFALRMGQISPWLLLGVVGFLCAARDRRDVLAGVALALLTIKPHVTYLLWPAALWWAWRTRRWRVLIGWLSALMLASGVVAAVEHGVFANYWTAASEPPLYWGSPTLGTWLRLALHPAPAWLQFVPSLIGGLGALVWVAVRRGPWRWEVIGPQLLVASVATAAYGWSYDQLVLLPAGVALISLVRSASRDHRLAVLGVWVASQAALLTQNLLLPYGQYYVWYPLAFAGIYWWGIRHEAVPTVSYAQEGVR